MVASYDNDQTGAAYSKGYQRIVGDPGVHAAEDFRRSHHLTDPLRNFKFLVVIHHKPAGIQGTELSQGIGFMSVSGLASTTEAIPYREGGMNTTVHQLPGQTSFSPVTMQRGVTLGRNSNGPWQWFRQLFDVVGGQGTGPANRGGNRFRCDVDIEVLEHPVTHLETAPDGIHLLTPVKLRLTAKNAWINGISFSDLNAGDNAVMVEQMTLVHEGFQVRYGSPGSNVSAARLPA